MDAASADLLVRDRWMSGLMLAGLQLCVLVMAGYVWLTVRAYRRGDTAIGVLLAALFVLVGGGWSVGVPLGLVFGWVFVRRWRVGWFMAGWTALVLLAAGNLTLAVVMKGMDPGEWRAAFGWLPDIGLGRQPAACVAPAPKGNDRIPPPDRPAEVGGDDD